MLNYADLNDIEFEYLCQDVMSRKLGIELRRFAAGRDGGIDLTDSAANPGVIVQIKHYMNTTVSGLMSSLKKEVGKVKKLQPEQYYVCCSKELSAKRIDEIYSLFSEYMDSEKNIITLLEIEDFLAVEANFGILKKHYKLWISSTNILQNLFNNDIFIDCEYLLSSIETDKANFVPTAAYYQALDCLSKHHTLFLIGDPGVGKTITSKMLILNFAAEDYRVRYTTDVTDLGALKRSISQDRDAKEIILLDDCFGQAYFEMKSSQGKELLALIRYVNFSKNKLLVLNSRVTIFQEAKQKTPELVLSLEKKEFKLQIINVSAITALDKAKILYNHMYFHTKDSKYFQAIKAKRNYMKIIEHENYNPRIIEFITNPNRYKGISSDSYFQFIVECLNNPHMVWDNEYEGRLQIIDRCLLLTLYSLSDTAVSYNLVKDCFYKRLENMDGIDTTVNQFISSLQRLQDSFIKVIDDNGIKKLSMANPSINDYLEAKLEDNPLEVQNILSSAISVPQYIRMLPHNQIKIKLNSFCKSGKIKKLLFETETEKNGYITSYIAINGIMEKSYKKYIIQYLKDVHDVKNYDKSTISVKNILIGLFDEQIFKFYELKSLLSDFVIFENILSTLFLDDLSKILSACYYFFNSDVGFIEMCEKIISDAVSWYCEGIDATQYDVDIYNLMTEHTKTVYLGHEEYDEMPDIDSIVDAADDIINSFIIDEIDEILSKLPGRLRGGHYLDRPFDISIDGIDSLVKSYVESDYNEEGYHHFESNSSSEIDLIFNR